MFIDDFWDDKGLLHTGVPPRSFSENGILFAAYFYFKALEKSPLTPFGQGQLGYAILNTYSLFFNPNPSDNNDETSHFSHDNMTGLYSLMYYKHSCYSLPIFRWNGRYWLHPRDIVFYATLRHIKLAYFFLPIVYFAAIISCMRAKEITSGKCLAWLRLTTLKDYHINKYVRWSANLCYKICEKLTNFKEAFSFYFKREDHPVNVEWSK